MCALRPLQTSETIAYQMAATTAHANPHFQSGARDSMTAANVRAMPRFVKIPAAAPRNAHTTAAIAYAVSASRSISQPDVPGAAKCKRPLPVPACLLDVARFGWSCRNRLSNPSSTRSANWASYRQEPQILASLPFPVGLQRSRPRAQLLRFLFGLFHCFVIQNASPSDRSSVLVFRIATARR